MSNNISPAAWRLRRMREIQGCSIREMARRSGVSHPYLSQLENGKVPMGHLSYEKAEAIAQVFEWTTLVLMEGYDG